MKEADQLDNNIEQTQESTTPATVVSRHDLSDVHSIANDLLVALARVPDGDLVGEIVANSLKLLRDNTNRGDIKLINKSFKELRYALKIFAPYRDVRKVSIFGSARTLESRAMAQSASSISSGMHLWWCGLRHGSSQTLVRQSGQPPSSIGTR